MARNPSGPELRASCLFERLRLSSRIKANDDTPNCRPIWFSDDRKGTSIIKDGILYCDCKGGSPKNYKRIEPDKVFDDTDYLEIKGKIDGTDWRRLSFHSLNDQFRLSLLRIQEGVISCKLYAHCDLTPEEQSVASSCLQMPTGRRYMRFDELTQVVTSPARNLEWTWLDHAGKKLPIKVLAGMKNRRAGRLFILDSETMAQWDKLE